MANKRITELQLISGITDSCNIPLDDTTQTYRATAPQFLEYLSAKGMPYTWDSAKTYASGDFVLYSGNIYVSLQGTNTNQNPATQPTFWTVYLFKYGFSAKSASYTITTTDNIRVLAMTTGGTDMTVNLPDAALSNGRPLTIKKVDGLTSVGAGKLTIARAGSDTIGGSTSQLLFSAGDNIEIIPNGTDWEIIKMRQFEYVYNTDTSGSTDTTNFGYGPGGVLIPNRSIGTLVEKRINWLSAPTDGDNIFVEVTGTSGSSIWTPSAQTYPYTRAFTQEYGIRLLTISSTAIDIRFGAAGATQTGSVYANDGPAWSSYFALGQKWRLVKTRII